MIILYILFQSVSGCVKKRFLSNVFIRPPHFYGQLQSLVRHFEEIKFFTVSDDRICWHPPGNAFLNSAFENILYFRTLGESIDSQSGMKPKVGFMG